MKFDFPADVSWTGSKGETNTSKTFQANEHTLKSALDWLSRTNEGSWWLSGSKPLKLIYQTDNSQTTTYTSTAITGKNKVADKQLINGGAYRPNESPAIDVITNDALSELAPPNSATVHGKSSMSIFGVDVNPLDDNKFPAVTVEHPTLKQRAGGTTIKGIIETTDDKTLKAATGSAKETLKNRITGSGEGEIEAYCAPYIIPGDSIRMVGECGDFAPNADMNPMEFMVTGVRHRKSSDDIARTYVTVSPKARKNEMTITQSEMLER